MVFKSEIRDSTINDLLEKAASKNYGKYLSKLVLKRIRGFTDEPVSFDFPVTALIGPNGGGKTTILGAAACAYKEVSPRRFLRRAGSMTSRCRTGQLSTNLWTGALRLGT